MPVQLHLVFGADDYLVEQKARAIVDARVPRDQRALGLEAIDGRVDRKDDAVAALRQTIESVQTLGFFGAAKLVWLRNATFLKPDAKAGGGGSGEEASDEPESDRRGDPLKDRLAELTALIKAGLPEGITLLISAPAVLRTTSFFKACQSAGEVSEFTLGEKNWEIEKLAAERLDGFLDAAGLRMSRDVRACFLTRAGIHSRLMVAELEKLSIYLGSGRDVVTEQDVDAIVSLGRDAEVWSLTDAIGERDLVKLARALRQLQAQEESPIRLFSMVESRIREWMVCRYAIEQRWLEFVETGGRESVRWSARMPPEADALLSALSRDPRRTPSFILYKQAIQANRYTLHELRRGRHALIQLRERLVTAPSRLHDALMEAALFRFVSPSPAARSRAAASAR